MKLFIKTTLFFLLILSLSSCKKSTGEKAAVSEAKEVAVAKGENYNVDVASSKISWTGSKITGSHSGTINVSDGNLSVDDGKISGGEFTIDMASIINTDMEAGQGKEKLEGHLKASDFFDVEKFPQAKFSITKVTALEGDADATHLVYGNLTMKDITKEVGFKASVSMSNGNLNVSTPKFAIDRTDWGLKYGSSSFFDDLGDKAINNEIDLEISLSAKA